MNILNVDAVSFATNIGQTAAAQMASLLYASEGDGVLDPVLNWFQVGPGQGDRFLDTDRLLELDTAVVMGVEASIGDLGGYVCSRQVEQGEQLFRWASSKAIVPNDRWDRLSFEQRQPWETFTGTCLRTYLELRVAQQAIEDERRVAGAAPAPTMKREDNALLHDDEVEEEGLSKIAIEAAGLMGKYGRGREEERMRQADAAWDAMRLDADADNAEFDRQKRIRDDEAKRLERNAAQRARRKPAPVSAGEAPVKPPVNRGGRGNKKIV